MRAMVLEHGGPGAQLRALERPVPAPMGRDVLLRVQACGVCRTDLHLLDGELPAHRMPVVPGHEIVGTVVALGAQASNLQIGARVGVPWLAGWQLRRLRVLLLWPGKSVRCGPLYRL